MPRNRCSSEIHTQNAPCPSGQSGGEFGSEQDGAALHVQWRTPSSHSAYRCEHTGIQRPGPSLGGGASSHSGRPYEQASPTQTVSPSHTAGTVGGAHAHPRATDRSRSHRMPAIVVTFRAPRNLHPREL